MTMASRSNDIDRGDLIEAVAFAQHCFEHWHTLGLVRDGSYQALSKHYSALRSSLESGEPVLTIFPLPSAEECWSCKQHLATVAKCCGECGAPAHTPETQKLRYSLFACNEIKKFQQAGILPLSAADACLAEANEHIAALRRYLGGERIPLAAAAEPAAAAPAARGRRNLLEILLDPRNIHMLLGFGGALMVVGLVILLWVNEWFTPLRVAVGLGLINAALLGAGWWLLRGSRYQMAGRAVTLLACLVLPLNLWYYHANDLITLDGHLWVAALVISALYAASALVLRDELFVYIFMAGVTLTGLLFLADLPPSPQKFWEIALPSTLLVTLGLLAIHAERAFLDQEGPFGRRRFGLAFFWSGNALLAAGLLLVLGADIAGDWLYKPVFQQVYERLETTPSPIVGELRWLALLLVVAGTYAYIYSDLVVRRVGAYVYVAEATLLWALILGLELLGIALSVEFYILTFALVGLGLLLAYRFTAPERFTARPLADATFQGANTLLSLSYVAALFLGLSRLTTHQMDLHLVGLFTALTAISLLSLALVRHAAWRRWYAVTTLCQAALVVLGMMVLSKLTLWQKLEVFSVAVGLLLLIAGHIGWYREQERENGMVSLSLLLGSLLAGVPLAIATLIDRSRDIIYLNEVGLLAAALLLVTTGFLFQLKTTTLMGAALTALYFVTLPILLPWKQLNTVAIFLTAGGGTLFGVGLLLSLYRDRLLMLPDRIKHREGMFRVLTWR
jgi:hypothetical protein